MDQALRNLVEALGLGLREASERVSTHAARYLGLADRGVLAVGATADMVVLDARLRLRQVIVEGQVVDDLDAAA
jgi:N-acetylglucosamine-6-phosphate deacetylase